MQTEITTTPALGVPGQIPDLANVLDANIRSGTSEEVSASIAFGRLVVKGTADDGVTLPTTQEAVPYGVVVFGQAYARSSDGGVAQLDDNGLTPGTTFGCLRVGEILVLATETVAPGDEVHYQAETTGGDAAVHPLGSFCKTAESGKTVDISAFAQWLSPGDVGDVVQVSIDLRNVGMMASDA